MTKLIEDDVPPLDANKIKTLNDQYGTEFTTKIVDLFITSTTEKLTLMKLALEKQDKEELFRHGHTLKGNALHVGAHRIHDLSLRLESSAQCEETYPLIPAIITELEKEFKTVAQLLRTEN